MKDHRHAYYCPVGSYRLFKSIKEEEDRQRNESGLKRLQQAHRELVTTTDEQSRVLFLWGKITTHASSFLRQITDYFTSGR